MERLPGKLIVLEGLDGAGTTSQSQYLVEWFQSRQMPVYRTAEPSQGEIGQFIRTFLKGQSKTPPKESMALLFAADRHDHLENEVLPQLRRGTHVVCDRYLLSSLAYQQASGVPQAFILSANEGVYSPDLMIFLDVPTEVAAQRRKLRNSARELYEAEAFLEKVASLYRSGIDYLKREQESVVVLDGSLPLEQVRLQIQQVVASHL